MVESTVESSIEVVAELAEKEIIRVLHVDDEPGFLKVARQLLEMQGNFEVETAVSVEEAVAKMKEKTFDAVVSDYVMPEKDGLQFLKELRDSGNTVPFIIFTGKGREEVAVKALNLSADRYINKIGSPETVYMELAHGIRQTDERRRVYEKLNREMRRADALLKIMPSGLFTVDLNKRITSWNKAAEQITGIKAKDIIGKNCLTTLNCSACKAGCDLYAEDVPKPIMNKECVLTGIGNQVTISKNHDYIKDHDGKIIGGLCSFVDITERKQVEESLRESEGKLNAMLQSISDHISMMDKDLNILWANETAKKIFGKDIIGKKCYEVYHGRRKPCEPYPCITLEVFQDRKVHEHDTQVIGKDGRIICFHCTASVALRDKEGKPTAVIEISRDITEHKQMEEALRESEEKYKGIFELAPDNILTLDLKGKITSCNTTAARLSGYSKDEIVGKHFAKLGFFKAKDLPKHLKMLSSIIRGKVAEPFEVKCYRRDGTPRWVETHISLMEKNGKTTGFQAIARDVTERKKAEEELRDATGKWGSLTKNTNDIIMIVDCKGVIQYINRTIPSYTPEETIGKTMYEYTLREQHDVIRGSLRKVFKTGKPDSYKISSNIPEIGTIWFSTKVVPIEHDREVVSAILISTDITERKKAEQKVRESEEKYRNMIELSPDSVVTVDMKGVITSVNTTGTRMLGYSRDELVGKSFSKTRVIRMRELPKFLKLFSSVLRGKIAKPLELTFYRKDGTPILCEVTVGLLKEAGKVIGVQAVSRDITERREAEKAIRESQQKFQRLFMDNPEAAVYMDSGFNILDINPRFRKLFGYSLDEVKGKHVNDVVVSEDKREEAERFDRKASKGETYQEDTIRKRKDGTLITVSFSAAPIIIEDKVIGQVAVYKDISQLKDTEKQLKETLEKLSVVGRLTRHDVRNKLSAITGNVYLAKQKLPSDHEVMEYLREIDPAVRHIKRIFDFARTYEKLGMEELAYMDVEKNIGEAVSLFSDLHGVKVVNDCKGLMVLADSLLKQVFYNLIHNSLRHGETVARIRVYYEEGGKDRLKLVYEDDGVGISKAEKEKIFREGYGKGTGYGLYLIRKTCEVYGWAIRETGKQGKGAEFVITIPKMSEKGKINYRLH